MEWINVVSSNIMAYRYFSPTKQLQVRFKTGKTYCYFDVPESVYDELENAISKGNFLNSTIKPNYRCVPL